LLTGADLTLRDQSFEIQIEPWGVAVVHCMDLDVEKEGFSASMSEPVFERPSATEPST
jgi:hypothetical protein